MQTPLPKLVVLSGLPRSGKSNVSKFLVDEMNFSHISSDHIREEYGMSFGTDDPREPRVNHVVMCRELEHLLMGENVVVDTTGMFRTQRKMFLDPHIASSGRLLRIKAQRILISLNIDSKIWEQRQLAAGRSLEQKPFYYGRFEPVDPEEQAGLDRHMIFNNNSAAEFVHIQRELTNHLATKP